MTTARESAALGEQSAARDAGKTPAADKPLIEIGVVVAGRLDRADYEAAQQARNDLQLELTQRFGEFRWEVPFVRRHEMVQQFREEPVTLLRRGSEEREAHEWDYAIVVTAADLVSHYKPFALAALSRSLDAAVVSSQRLDPQSVDVEVDQHVRINAMRARLRVLALHVFGHLNGLTHADDPSNLMYEVESVDELAGMQSFTPEQLADMGENLRQIADQRLEEQEDAQLVWLWSFYLRGIWINRHEIADAVVQAKPWQFPQRLVRLTTAAVSTMMVLMLTAETWDLALHQPLSRLAGMLLFSLFVTTAYVVARQQLLVRRDVHRVSEQTVITNVSSTTVVLLGLATTAAVLLAATFLAGMLLYRESLVERWAAPIAGGLGAFTYLRMSMFVSSVGLLIGALGASFEAQHHFQHITFVDEET